MTLAGGPLDGMVFDGEWGTEEFCFALVRDNGPGPFRAWTGLRVPGEPEPGSLNVLYRQDKPLGTCRFVDRQGQLPPLLDFEWWYEGWRDEGG